MTEWQKKVSAIQVGDQVMYSKKWLQSIGEFTGTFPFARGTVTELKPLGGITLAVIDWGKDKDEVPGKVNVKNLSVVKNGQVMDRD